MSDDDMVRRGDVMMVISKERQWASGCNPVLVVDRCIAAVRDMPAIAAIPAVTPATSPGVTAGAAGLLDEVKAALREIIKTDRIYGVTFGSGERKVWHDGDSGVIARAALARLEREVG